MKFNAHHVPYLLALLSGALLPAAAAPIHVEETAPDLSIPVSEPVRLVADSQIHEFYGIPTFLSGALADQVAEVAIRPSQQRLFGPRMLESALADTSYLSPGTAVVHLGDAIDVSCKTEWTRFVDSMKSGGAHWTLAPGNHDGFFVGNAAPKDGNAGPNMLSAKYGSVGWKYRCGPDSGPVLTAENGADRLPKPQLLTAYQQTRGDIGLTRTSCGKQCEIWANKSGFPRYHARLSESAPWTSFVVQAIDVSQKVCKSPDGICPRTILVLVDTSVYSTRPTFRSHPAGVVGGMGPDQLSLLSTWLGEWSSPDTVLIVAGHHPLDRINSTRLPDGRSKQSLKGVLCSRANGGRASLYVSAHTHDGWWKMHQCDDRSDLPELNVGSVLDWPPHFRSLQIVRSPTGSLYIQSRRFDIPLSDQSCGRWVVDESDERSPTRQKLSVADGNAVEQARDALNRGLRAELLEYRALHTLFPSPAGQPAFGFTESADAISDIDELLAKLNKETFQLRDTRNEPELLLSRLRSFEDVRRVADERGRGQYFVCMGAWAAKVDANRSKSVQERNPPHGVISGAMTAVSVFKP